MCSEASFSHPIVANDPVTNTIAFVYLLIHTYLYIRVSFAFV
jgi:hypothetical protein